MERIAVKSSNIKEIGYETVTKTMEVVFSNGTVYRYGGVPKKSYEEMVASESVGKYFHAKIKPFYKHTRQEDSDKQEEEKP